jgi:O-antigen/teichoic acid export membrane protein
MLPTESDSILRKSARGSVYSLGVSAVTLLLGFTRAVLLMRLLQPELFGLMALALVFSTLVRTISTMGLDGALIQRKDAHPHDFSTHFVLRLSLSLAMLAVGWLASPVIRQAYGHQAVVVDVLLILLAIKVLEASYATHAILLQREMRFGAVAAINLIASLAMTVVAPSLAYLGAGLWSLVAEQAVGPVVRWICLWVFLRPWRITLNLRWERAKSAVKFGWQLFSANMLSVLLNRFADFWVGTSFGAVALGYYSRAYDIAQYPARVLATPIAPVFFSTYARTQDDKLDLSKAFFRSSSFLVRVGFPLVAILVISAPEITMVLFGETWLPVVPIMRLMLVYMLLEPLMVNLGYLVVGVGNPQWLTRVRLIQVLFFIVAVIILGNIWGVNGVALSASLMMLVGTLLLLLLSRRLVRYSLKRLFAWPLMAVLLAGGASLFLAAQIESSSLWGILIIKITLVLGIYGLVLYLAERHVIHQYGLQMLRMLINTTGEVNP